MRFIVVNTERLNIYLSKSEAEKENISIEKMATETYNIKEKLGLVFERARESTGFDCIDKKLKIEILPMIDGDILISVQKTNSNEDGVYIKNKILTFEFESFDNLSEGLLNIDKYYIGRESVYKFKDRYFLVLYIHKINFSDINMLRLILLEYGFESKLSHMVLREHGNLIISGNAKTILREEYK